MIELVQKVVDPYERQARLWPALLAGLPLFSVLSLLYGSVATLAESVAVIAVSCGGLYLLSNVCRDLGKRLERRLFDLWGGKPTTQLLRHRDGTIEAVTKQRYHAFLSGKIATPFPDRASEQTDPKTADEIYQSGIRWLLNQTRDANVFGLLLQENIAYGFRRNALALKPIGLLISILTFSWVLIDTRVIKFSADHYVDLVALATLSMPAWMSLLIAISMTGVWTLFFTMEAVRRAAFAYAESLLRACDVLK